MPELRDALYSVPRVGSRHGKIAACELIPRPTHRRNGPSADPANFVGSPGGPFWVSHVSSGLALGTFANKRRLLVLPLSLNLQSRSCLPFGDDQFVVDLIESEHHVVVCRLDQQPVLFPAREKEER
jgi:hypothetical protein